jgi:hypothetical protein
LLTALADSSDLSEQVLRFTAGKGIAEKFANSNNLQVVGSAVERPRGVGARELLGA